VFSDQHDIYAHRKLLLGILVFIAILLPLSSEAMIRLLVIPNDHIFRNGQLFRTHTGQDAAFGDSHTMRGLVSMPGMLNFGQGGETSLEMAMKVREHYKNSTGFRIILQASPQMLKRELRIRDRTRLFFFEPDPPLLYLPRPYFRERIRMFWRTLFHNPFFHNRRVWHENGASLSVDSMKDWSPSYTMFKARDEVRSHMPPQGFQDSEAARIYRSLAEWLVSRNAEVCFLTTPVAASYAELAKQEPQYRLSLEWYGDLAREFGFRHVDFFEGQIPDRYFADNNHMNVEGAHYLGNLVYNVCFDQ